jgi:uncharacterized membrane protein YoaK (UPF0700 family)
MRFLLLALLSLNAGYVDAVGFLALHGLFTTHITGNFVTLGASLAFGASGVLAKLLALPLFFAVVLAARVADRACEPRGWPTLRILFGLQAVLLALGAAIAAKLGPFPDGDAWPALAAGGALVAAMALQNAAHRTRLTAMPPSTILTGPITQMTIDVADLTLGLPPERRAAAKSRSAPIALAVAAFAVGCGAGALGYVTFKELCLVAPPALAALAFCLARPEIA